jgi:hypothetical protein
MRRLACARARRCRRRVIDFTFGLILIGVTFAMVILARPSDGESAPFLKSWIVGQLYALTAMVSAVIGVTIVISTWGH